MPTFFKIMEPENQTQIIQVNTTDPTKFLTAVDSLPGVPPTDLEDWAVDYFKNLLTPSPSLRGIIFRFTGLVGAGATFSLLIEAGKQIWLTNRGWWMAAFILLLGGMFWAIGRWLIEYHHNFRFLYLTHWGIVAAGFVILGAIAIWG